MTKGIQLDFVSSKVLSEKTTMEKIEYIMDRVKVGTIVVLEEGLNPVEEAELIETTMREIDMDKFHGIEVYRIQGHEKTKGIKSIFGSVIGKKSKGLTIIGPTNYVEAIKKEPDFLSMLAKPGDL
ncbi:MAG: DUF2073 domain-containing protein [Candidatus Hydrothermarchaeota archaeon]